MPKLDSHLLDKARQVDFIAYLQQLGHSPTSARPHKATFHSPLREDHHPSFSVSYVGGGWKWYDFGTGEHGDLIDFVQRYFQLSFQDSVAKILQEQGPSALNNPVYDAKTRTGHPERQQLARRRYRRARAAMTPAQYGAMQRYFHDRLIPYRADLGAVYFELEPTPGEHRTPFIGIPVPSANLDEMKGIECRALHDTVLPKDLRRRTLGDKSLWLSARPISAVLVTESILDCLAGEELMGPQFTLCALNGIPNADLLLPAMRRLRPDSVHLALDNDPEDNRGPATQRWLKDQLLADGFDVMEVRHHHDANVKDLHRLLLATRRAFSVL